MRRGLIAGVFVSAVPALILLSARDVEAQADAGANACVIDLAGAVYARLDCSTRMRPDLVDDTDASFAAGQLQIVLRAADRSPAAIVSVHVSGVPHLGWQPHQLVAWVKSGSRTWDARDGAGSSTLMLTSVQKIHVDGGIRYELHGNLVATVPDAAGGPAVVLSATF